MKPKRTLKQTILLLVIMLVSFGIAVFFISREYLMVGEKEYSPQVNRAVMNIAEILPQMEEAENALMDSYDKIEANRLSFLSDRQISEDLYGADLESVDDLVKDTLSWQDRIIDLRIGNSGGVFVTDKDGVIVAHRNDEYIGSEITTSENLMAQSHEIISYSDLKDDIEKGVEHYRPEWIMLGEGGDSDYLFEEMYYGVVIEYNDYYIVCGVPYYEYFGYNFALEAEFFLCLFIVLWIMFRYITINLSRQTRNIRQVMIELLSVSVILSLGVFVLSWYNQNQIEVSENLNNVAEDATSALETVSEYESKKERIDDWIDSQYLVQCQIARDIVKEEGTENITRERLAEYSQALGVEAIYVYDKNGKVIVTDGPYDHFELSEDEKDQSYAFRVLLEGADHVVLEPAKDEVTGEYSQYIGTCLRDENDLSNGFVQICVDPVMHDELLSDLDIDSVLTNLKVGVTEDAFAVDKSSMKVTNSTGVVFVGEKLSDVGLDVKEIKGGIDGFVIIYDEEYYAACSENADYLFITLKDRRGVMSTIKVLFEGTLVCFVIMLLMMLPAYFFMKKTFVHIEDDETEADIMEAYVTGEGNFEKEAVEEKEEKAGFFDSIKEKFAPPPKPRFDARWKVNTTPLREQTPGQQIMHVIYRIMFLYCMISLASGIYRAFGGQSIWTSSTAYQLVTDNAWKKGINIFALSACMNMLCTMYVIVVVLTRILYQIARVASMRIETVCMLIRNSLKYICFVIFLFYWLSQFGVKTTTLLASAGIMSVVIGIGAKDLVNDIIAGFFMIFEGSFKVGDWVKVGDWIGMIREIGIRTTKVEFFSETMVLNNSSMRDVAVTDGPTTYLRINLPVAYNVDLEWLEGILEEELPGIVDKLPFIKRAKYQGINDFTNNAMIIRIYIFTVSYKRGPALRQFNRELKLLFDRNGIAFPVNQISIQQASATEAKSFDDIDFPEEEATEAEEKAIGIDIEDE